MTRTGFFVRLAICIAVDLFDLTLGRIPLLGTIEDGAATVVMVALWGPVGLAYAWELADVTDQIDAFVPTATLIALYVGWRQGFLGRGSRQTARPIP